MDDKDQEGEGNPRHYTEDSCGSNVCISESTALGACHDSNVMTDLEPGRVLNVCGNIMNCQSGIETLVLDACDTTKLDPCDSDSAIDIGTNNLDDIKFFVEGFCEGTNSTLNTNSGSYYGTQQVTDRLTKEAGKMVDRDKSNDSLNYLMESISENENSNVAMKSPIPDQSCDFEGCDTSDIEEVSTIHSSSVIEDLKKLKREINDLPFLKSNTTDQNLPQESSSEVFLNRNELPEMQEVERSEEPYGLDFLFSEISVQPEKVKVKGGRSKAARKRKAQQQRLVSLLANNKTKPSRRFARSFQELVRSPAEWETAELEASLVCPVCLEMYHLPHACYPCSHMFCDPCLRRLTSKGVGGIPCPLCRTTIQACHLDQDFDERLMLTHPDIYTARAMAERKTKYRYYKLPFTPPIPIGRQLLRHLVAARANPNPRGMMSQDLFKVMAGCLCGVCVTMFIMRCNNVGSLDNAQYINMVFVSLVCGAAVAYLAFKVFRIRVQGNI